MRIFLIEVQKSFYHTKGWLVLLIFIFSQIIFFCSGNQSYNFQTERYNEQYREYLITFGGKVNIEKEFELKTEEERIAFAEEQSMQSFQKLYNGEYTPAKYDEEVKKYNKISEQKMAFKQIQNQYDYARQDTTTRYVMDENGWTVAFQENGLNFYLIFFVVFCTVRIFSQEYETNMHDIITCTYNGRNCTVISKTTTSLLYVVLFGLLSSATCLLVSFFRFGLPHADYPLQSLQFFSTCTYDLTIWQGYVLVWTFKIFSLCIISTLAMLCEMIFKNSVIAIFLSSIIVILPYFVFELEIILRFIPFLGLILGAFYFRGIECISTNQVDLQLQAISLSALLLVLGIGFTILLICLLFSTCIWNNHKISWRKINEKI